MKLVSFLHRDSGEAPRVGVLHGASVVDPFVALYSTYGGHDAEARAAVEAPRDMLALIEADAVGSGALERALLAAMEADTAGRSLRGPRNEAGVVPIGDVTLLAPVPRPPRMRDYITYKAHADGAGLALSDAFDRMPICYECNVGSVIGPEQDLVWPAYTSQLDYELELGFFVGRAGRNLSVDEATKSIFGVTLFNDVSARDIQVDEMSLAIGPSKGKDFCNVLGPCIVTMDEIDEWNIELSASVNGEIWSQGTSAGRRWSFAEVLAWASYCVDVTPGEFIGVGTVGAGCGYEVSRWIQPGDIVELSSPQIGTLRNRVGSPEKVPAGAGLPSYTGSAPVPPPPSH
jgi:2-keto-4-pentenoate hydratase/2-oxohepta-3-ene-1,7-dioic acid hydratase in catechol pathway